MRFIQAPGLQREPAEQLPHEGAAAVRVREAPERPGVGQQDVGRQDKSESSF